MTAAWPSSSSRARAAPSRPARTCSRWRPRITGADFTPGTPRVPGLRRGAARVPQAAALRGERHGPRHRRHAARYADLVFMSTEARAKMPFTAPRGRARGRQQPHAADAPRSSGRDVGAVELRVDPRRRLPAHGTRLAGLRARRAPRRDVELRGGAGEQADQLTGRVEAHVDREPRRADRTGAEQRERSVRRASWGRLRTSRRSRRWPSDSEPDFVAIDEREAD